MLKKEDWGGLTIVALLATIAFPPYFLHLMTMAALTEFAHLWTTRISRVEQEKLVKFEKEFREGYKYEKEGRISDALKLYRELEKRYGDDPRISRLATLQIRKLAGDKSGPKLQAKMNRETIQQVADVPVLPKTQKRRRKPAKGKNVSRSGKRSALLRGSQS